MPVAPQVTYPGVYVQEVPSSVRTIVPVDTATTAFIGRARRGPVDEPLILASFGDFEREFGGLWNESSLGFAVRDFFLNGGGKAVVVRLFAPEGGEAAKSKAAPEGGKAGGAKGDKPAEKPGAGADAASDGCARLDVPAQGGAGLKLRAVSPGTWGDGLRVTVSAIEDPDVRKDVAAGMGQKDAATLFDLTVSDSDTGALEVFRNVTLSAEGPRRVDEVLEASKLVRVDSSVGAPGAAPTPTPVDPETGEPKSLEAAGGADGGHLDDLAVQGNEGAKTGLYALEHTDIFNLLCIPPYLEEGQRKEGMDVGKSVLAAASAYCRKRRAVLLVDPPPGWGIEQAGDYRKLLGLGGDNAAFFFPRIKRENLLRGGKVEEYAPSGAVAGVIARTDSQRGVWKAPAGLEATLPGLSGLSVPLTDAENGLLNPRGVNCIRSMPAAGPVVWGARTVAGDDRLASQWKYLPVRRTALYIEESLYRGTQWAVFEPNDEPLWSQLRLNIGTFMQGLFLQGAFQGSSPKDAYLVKCDATTTSQADIDRGIVNIVVGFAPLKPAEFVVMYIQQLTSNAQA